MTKAQPLESPRLKFGLQHTLSRYRTTSGVCAVQGPIKRCPALGVQCPAVAILKCLATLFLNLCFVFCKSSSMGYWGMSGLSGLPTFGCFPRPQGTALLSTVPAQWPLHLSGAWRQVWGRVGVENTWLVCQLVGLGSRCSEGLPLLYYLIANKHHDRSGERPQKKGESFILLFE